MKLVLQISVYIYEDFKIYKEVYFKYEYIPGTIPGQVYTMTVIVLKKLIAFKEGKIGNIISNYTENMLIHVFVGFTGT